MKTNTIFSAEGRFNTKSKRINAFRRLLDSKIIPESYQFNTIKEELCCEYISKFITEFQVIHPKRKRPYMIAENESGIGKIICSTIRPTQLQYTELYDAYECASFFAGYILYEPLQVPTEPPEILPSPAQTLAWHTGDCFDMAILLCSFLLGSGYDAYVVNGYAPKFITLRDQSKTQCPLASATFEMNSNNNDDNNKDDADNDGNPYKPPDDGIRESKFVADQEERRRIAGLDKFILWASDADDPVTEPSDDNIRRVHAWVLVRSGRRDMREHVFLEPSTGRAYQLTNSPYTGIESVFSDKNVWMNTTLDKKISLLDFDLTNTTQWEHLFIPDNKGPQDEVLDGNERGEAQDQLSVEAKDASGPAQQVLDPPPSWVSPLVLERQQYLIRYPPFGRRTVQYLRAKVDYFAKNSHPQAMVMRVIFYLDKARTSVKEIHEWFENRKDHMYKRVRYCLEDRVCESYSPGSAGEVRQWTEFAGKKREIDFYVSARLDRMKRREEEIGKKISEYFEGRTDRLVFRSVNLSAQKADAGARPILILNQPRADGGAPRELFVLKMTQSFAQDPKAPSGSDISKRYFHIPEGKVISHYHFVTSKITRKTKVYNHARGTAGTTLSSQNTDEISDEDLEGLQEAATSERECYKQTQESYDSIQALMRKRDESESNVIIERSVFETALDRADKGASGTGNGDGVGADSKGVDYLTPYLRNIRDATRISKDEAMEVRQACLDGLKARLVERANIIQTRLNEENQKLARKQEQFQRSQREGDLSTEEYERYCTEAMFRINILEQRLASHEEAALKKFSNLDQKLNSDPRLRILKH